MARISLPSGAPGGGAITDASMAAAYGPSTGAKVAADPLLKAAYVPQLAPSGGDDAPAIAAQIAAYGRCRLGPGVFRVNSPQVLRAFTKFRTEANAYAGLVIEGSGQDITILDTSGAGATSHDLATVSGVTVGTTTTVTLSAAVSWVDGSQAVITLPSYQRGHSSGNTIELLSGLTVFLKANTRDGSGNATAFTVYCDSALTTKLISTGWGTFATPATIRRYENDRTKPYTPIFRLTGPVAGRPDIYNLRVRDLTFRNTLTENTPYDRQGICVSLESDRTDSDTTIAQQVRFDGIRFEGYDVAVLMDDCTNVAYEGCDFHGNNYATWSAKNVDIVRYANCMFGDDYQNQGQPLQQVTAPALTYYAPINPTEDYSGSRNNVTFDTCWFMAVRAVTGGSQVRTYGGAQVYWTNGLNPKPLSFLNCYFEQVSWIGEGQNILASSCHFGNFDRDQNLTNGRALFCLQTDNYDGARFTIENCTSDPNPGSGPLIAYVSASNWGTNGGQANEETTPTIIWRLNNLPAGSGAAHIIDFLAPTRKILLGDNYATGIEVKGGGDYVFEGVLQTGGLARLQRTANPFTGTLTPDVLAATRYWVGDISGAVTIANPTVGGSTTFSSLFAASGSSSSSFFLFVPLRHLPLEFIVTQNATGSFAVAFGTDFITTGLTLTGTAGQRTVFRFAWNGSKWAPLGANTWA